MKIKVKLHPNSSQEKIKKLFEHKSGDNLAHQGCNKRFSNLSNNFLNSEEFILEIWIKERPINSSANNHLVKILKKYFKPCKSIKIIKGLNSRNKIIEILN